MHSAGEFIAAAEGSPRAAPPLRSAHDLPAECERFLDAQTEMLRELKMVGEIQRSLLPERLPKIPGFDLASYYHPSTQAGGDYFDIVPLIGDQWGLVMADVAGHGVSAAVIMAVLRSLVHAHLPYTRSIPACAFLEFINSQITNTYVRDGRFVTQWCAALDPGTRRVTYASAGHNPPRIVRDGAILELDAVGGMPMGIDGSASYEEVSVTLEPDDLLVIYTDGIPEATRHADGSKEFFLMERFDEVLVASGQDSAQECIDRVAAAVNAFSQSTTPADDQTMLVIRAL